MSRVPLPDDLFSDLRKLEQRLDRLEVALRPEEIRYIGSSGNPAFQNSWTNYHISYTLAGFYRHLGRTYLQGMIAGGVLGVVFTLPPGYQPRFAPGQTSGTRLLLDTQSNSGVARIDIDGVGNVVMVAGSSSWTTLDGISFRHA